MSEPNIKIEIPNTDIVYAAPAVDTGFNIITFFDSKSGRFEPIKYSGIPHFTSECLTTSEVQVTEDDTVKHFCYILNYTAAYGRRVGSMTMRQGVSSLGELLLFTSSNELVPKYWTLEIKEWLDKLDYYYIAYGADMYYVGSIDNMDPDEKAKFVNHIQVHTMKSVDQLVANAYKYFKDNITLLKTNNMTLLAREEWTFSPNLSVTVTENANQYKIVSNVAKSKMSTGDYLQVRGTTYYFQGDGSFNPTRLNDPVAIFSNTITEGYDAGLFFLQVLSKVQDTQNSYTLMPEVRGDGGLVIHYKDIQGKWTIDSYCEKHLKVVDGGNGLGIFDADDDITTGAIKLHFHKDPLPSPPPVETSVLIENQKTDRVQTIDLINVEKFTSYKVEIGSIKLTNTSDGLTRNLVVSVGRDEVGVVPLDFTNSLIAKNITVPEFDANYIGRIYIEGKDLEIDKVTVTKIVKTQLTEEELNGIDIKYHFSVGVPSELAKDGEIEISLSENPMNALKAIMKIIENFDTDENDDLEYRPDVFRLSTMGSFEAYFEKRDTINKGTRANSDIKSIEITPDGAKTTYQYDFLSDSQMEGSMKNSDFWLKINNAVFYVGKYLPKVKADYRIPLSKTPVTFLEFKELLEGQLPLYNSDFATYQNNYCFLSDIDVDAQGVDFIKGEEKQYSSAQFAVIQKFSTTVDAFSMSYKKLAEYTNTDVYNLTLGFKDGTSSWDISFDKAAVDGYGRALYFDRVKYDYLDIIKLEGTQMLEQLDTFKWGKDITPRKATVNDYIDAINKLEELENHWFDVIWDAGKAHPSIAIACDKMANKLFMLNMISLPTEYEYNQAGFQKIKEYAANLAMNSRFSRIVWAKVRTGNVGNFAFEVNGSGLALRALITNYSGGSTEFCAQMGVNYGTLEGDHLILPSKKDREELVDKYKIATVKGGDGVYPYHINDNTTTQSFKSSYSEEQNVRMGNAVAHGLDRIFYTYLGLKNDFFTRNRLIKQFSNFIETRCINNQIFAMDGYQVVCDSSNNTEEMKANNVLRVDVYVKYPRAIKYGLLYINTMPLDTGSTQSA